MNNLRFFKKAIGYGFNEYINQLRAEKSKGLLAARNQDILDVALECGFDNQRSFDRIFKKHVNMTPSEYQKKCWLSRTFGIIFGKLERESLFFQEPYAKKEEASTRRIFRQRIEQGN